MNLQWLHLLASLALASATSLECAMQNGGECIDNKSKKCLDAAAFGELVASFPQDESVLPLLRGTVDVLSQEEVAVLYTNIAYHEFIDGFGYSKKTIEAPPAVAGLGLQELSTSWKTSFNTMLEMRYNKILELREKVRSAAESALGLCPGTLLIHTTAISQKSDSGAHGTHADNCYHYFDETTGKATCDTNLWHPYTKRVAASITYLNDQSSESGNFEGGEFYFANRTMDNQFPRAEETEEIVPINPGKMIYFTSGAENMHGGLPVRKRQDHQFGSPEPHRRALAIWYVFDKSWEEQVPPFVKKIEVPELGEELRGLTANDNGSNEDGNDANKDSTLKENAHQDSCSDKYDKCKDWASMGLCDANPVFMLLSCRSSCMVCSEGLHNSFYRQSMEYAHIMRRIISYFAFGPKVVDKTHEVAAGALKAGCFDKDKNCAEYAKDEECDKNPGYMHHYCAASCNTCACKDDNFWCKEWAGKGQCDAHPSLMHEYCRRSCMICIDGTNQFGAEQNVPNYASDSERHKTKLHIAESIEYMKAVWSSENFSQVRHRCKNLDERCSFWAATGQCEKNQEWMQTNCAPACSSCDVLGMMPGDLSFLLEKGSQFGVEQNVPNYASDSERHKTKLHIAESIEYMKTVWSSENFSQVRHRCKNLDERCSFWAASGECEKNREWMQTNCAPACSSCDALDIRKRCPVKAGNECIWKPGDLNTLMENIVDNSGGSGEYAKFNPKALSRPQRKQDGLLVSTRKQHGIPASDEAPRRKRQGLPSLDVVKDGPWVVSLENFVTVEEADRLVEIGKRQGYQRSAEVSEELPDGTHKSLVSESRTSTNSWCQEGCMDDPLVLPVIERIANVTKTGVKNSENLQLLYYEPGQFYKRHHDYLPHQVNMPCGVRILTLFIYLSDVEEGGGTHFPLLNITVQPKKGNAILWPSVLDQSPESKDERTDHEAMPVIKGLKYGANAWIHSRDFAQAYKDGCH